MYSNNAKLSFEFEFVISSSRDEDDQSPAIECRLAPLLISLFLLDVIMKEFKDSA